MKLKHGANRRIAGAQKLVVSASLSVFLAGCGSPNYAQSELHLSLEEVQSAQPAAPESIPSLVKTSVAAPALTGADAAETYDVVVTNVPVRDLLFALSRDSGINMDIDSRVGGLVSINAIDQTLEAILERLKEQVDLRVVRVGDAMVIKPDEPYHKKYDVSYISISRSYSSNAASGTVGDSGTSSISNTADNDFWQSLDQAIGNILNVAGQTEQSGAVATLSGQQGEALAQAVDASETRQAEDSTYDLNRNAGVLLVYATERLHNEVAAYLDQTLAIAKRQVLLEATIVEVVLSNQYAQGVDWSIFNSLATEGLALYQGSTTGGPAAALNQLTQAVTRGFTTLIPIAVPTSGANSNPGGLPLVLLSGGAVRDNYISAGRTGFNAQVDSLSSQFVGNPTDSTIEFQTQTTALSDDFGANTTIDNRPSPGARVANAFDVSTGSAVYIDNVNRGNYQAISGISGRAELSGELFNRDATVRSAGGLDALGANPNNFFTGVYRSGDISAAVQLLDRFGDTKVLSSPRITALNNQAALLRVGTQEVYFNIEVDEDINEDTGRVTERSFNIEEQTVDTGFSMNVLPFIDANGEILLNLRPAVNRVLRYVNAPTPTVLGAGTRDVENRIPILAQRELETMIALRDGEVAVLGGLLEDRTSDSSTGIPGLSDLPGVGALFEQTNQATNKTEFIVFIKARIIKNASVYGDYADFTRLLPDSDFIHRDRGDTYLPPAQKKAR